MVYLLAFMRTAFTIELIGQFSLKGVLDDIVSLVCLEETLYFFHQGIQELVCIGLHHGVDRDSFVGYEGITKFFHG